MRLTPDGYAALLEAGVPHSVWIENAQALIDREQRELVRPPLRGSAGWFDSYKSYADVSTYVNTLVSLRPDMVTRLAVGQSVEQREIFGLRIAAPGTVPGSRPGVLVMSAQHSREWITVMSSMYLADQLIRTYDTNGETRRLLDNLEFYIVPIVNPDGYLVTWSSNRLWRKNRRINADTSIGVDLNRNWGFNWGGQGASSTPGSDTFRGPSAFSEPCTQAIRDFMLARPSIAMAFDVHSFSQLILEPYAYTFEQPRDPRTYTQASIAIQQAMSAPANQVYLSGQTYRTIYPASGASTDWFAGDRGAIGYGFELRDRGSTGFLLPAAQIVPASIESANGIRAGAGWMLDNVLATDFPAGRPAWLASNASTTTLVQFSRGVQVPADLSTVPVRVLQRVGRIGPFTESTLSVVGSEGTSAVLSHLLIAGPCSARTQWYYQVPTASGASVTIPPEGANNPFEAISRDATLVFADDFEIDRGWTSGDTTSPDTASNGLWIRDDPMGTQAQAEHDHTPLSGAQCYITGQNARGTASTGALNSGKTTLNSPVVNTAAAGRYEARMWLWFFNSVAAGGSDVLAIDRSNGSGWTRALTIDANRPIAERTGRWTEYTVDLGAPGPSTRIRVVATSTGQRVEAAIDDVAVYRITCERAPCTADFSADGVVNVPDIFAFLSAWFAGYIDADIDGNPGLEVPDVFAFLAAWFAGCV